MSDIGIHIFDTSTLLLTILGLIALVVGIAIYLIRRKK